MLEAGAMLTECQARVEFGHVRSAHNQRPQPVWPAKILEALVQLLIHTDPAVWPQMLSIGGVLLLLVADSVLAASGPNVRNPNAAPSPYDTLAVSHA